MTEYNNNNNNPFVYTKSVYSTEYSEGLQFESHGDYKADLCEILRPSFSSSEEVLWETYL